MTTVTRFNGPPELAAMTVGIEGKVHLGILTGGYMDLWKKGFKDLLFYSFTVLQLNNSLQIFLRFKLVILLLAKLPSIWTTR